VLRLGARTTALGLSAQSWRPPTRTAIAREIWQGSAPLLMSFGLMSTLLTVVIARIVLVTAQSYGLSQYALEMVVRVLVLELIPLLAALFVALRVSLPAAVKVSVLQKEVARTADGRLPVNLLRAEVLPRAVGSAFAVLLLAALSGIIGLTLTYLLLHGFTPWGLERYTRIVGRIFDPSVTLIFSLKTLGFAAAVALIPLGSAVHDRGVVPGMDREAGVELRGLVRLFAAILLIELLSLVGNYA
jgi:phospholipid/cholesterol/gamma-HCH transport system permease protein